MLLYPKRNIYIENRRTFIGSMWYFGYCDYGSVPEDSRKNADVMLRKGILGLNYKPVCIIKNICKVLGGFRKYRYQ